MSCREGKISLVCRRMVPQGGTRYLRMNKYLVVFPFRHGWYIMFISFSFVFLGPLVVCSHLSV